MDYAGDNAGARGKEDYHLEVQGICKTFGLLRAVDHVSLQVRPAEVHALLGENGAGKSTLMAMLFGILPPDEGLIYLKGNLVRLSNPHVALAHGIGMVHQHFKLVDRFSALDNVALGLSKARTKGLRQRMSGLGQRYGLSVDLDLQVGLLSVGDRQKVEILKVLNLDADLLILDEPTAVLTPQEIDALMHVIRQLKSEGKTVIFISHKLKEIKQIADRCTVLRQGRNVVTCEVSRTSTDELAELMVGRRLARTERQAAALGEVVLDCRDLCVRARGRTLQSCQLQVRAGEIVGVAGVSGNGQHELIAALHGRVKVESGQILLQGKDITHSSVARRQESKLAYVAEDRHRFGVVQDLSLQENLLLRAVLRPPYSRWGLINWKAVTRRAEQMVRDYDIRFSGGVGVAFASLSGGNQQKAVLAREFESSPCFLIAEQPTRGMDAGAISYVHHRLQQLRLQGVAILLVSWELDELMELSDRIVVLASGRVSGSLEPPFDEYEIGGLMGGLQSRGGRQ